MRHPAALETAMKRLHHGLVNRREVILGACSGMATAAPRIWLPKAGLVIPVGMSIAGGALDEASAAGPFLWLFRTIFGRTLARENLKFAGTMMGRAARVAVAPTSAANAMTWGGAIGTASAVGLTLITAHELVSIYKPGWIERLRQGLADREISADTPPENRLFGMQHSQPWPDSANLVYGARIVTPESIESGKSAPDEYVIGHQAPIVQGEVPQPFAAPLPVEPSTYGVVPFAYDLDRQRFYLENGDIPPPIINVR